MGQDLELAVHEHGQGGVWTRPADQAVFSLRLFSRLVSARVAFMPISQSERARQAAASASPWSSSPGRS